MSELTEVPSQPREPLRDRQARIRAEVAAARVIATGGEPDPTTPLTAAALERVRNALGHDPASEEHGRLTARINELRDREETARAAAATPASNEPVTADLEDQTDHRVTVDSDVPTLRTAEPVVAGKPETERTV